MKISSTNNFPNAASSFSVTSDAEASQTISDIETGDFSTAYTSAGSSATFTIAKTFSASFACEYVAIAGHTFGSIAGGGTLTVNVNGVTKGTVVFAGSTNNDVVFVHFDSVTCTSIELSFVKFSSSDRVTITYVSAGQLLDSVFSFPNQNVEQSGYPRIWRTDSKKIKATLNNNAQPVAHLRESIARKVNLQLDNISISTTSSQQWLDFISSVYSRGDFFIKERDGDHVGIADDPKSSYMCFQAEVMPPKAHPATRQLNNLTISFSAYTGH